MNKNKIWKLLFNNQFWVSLIGGLSMFCAGASYTWLAPLMVGLQSNHSLIPMTSEDISWSQATFEIGSALSSVPAGHLADYWGRKPMLLSYGPLVTLSCIFLALIKSKVNVYICRFVQGGLTGLPYTILPFYLAEISQPEVRGAVTSVNKIMWHFGMLYSYTVGALANYEVFTYSMTIPSIIFTIGFFKCPESPYFLMMQNRKLEASKSLFWLRGRQSAQDEISEALKDIELAVKDDQDKRKGSFKDLLATSGSRKALFLSQFITTLFVMSGGTIIEIFEASFVKRMSNSEHEASFINIILGLALIFVIIPSILLVDRVGRRPLLLISGFGSAVSLLMTTILLYFAEVHGLAWASLMNASSAASIVTLCFLTLGVEPVGPVLQSELFNSNTRGIVSGISTVNISIFSLIVIIAYQQIEASVGLYLIYLIFFCFAVAGLIVIYFFLPETKGKSLEEIQTIF